MEADVRLSAATWKVRRLMAMTPLEVVLRTARGVRNRARRPRRVPGPSELVRGGPLVGVAARATSERLARLLDERRHFLTAGGRDPEGVCAILNDAPRRDGGTVERANAILEGRVRAFGWREIALGMAPDWHLDPDSGGRWPLAYWADIDYRTTAGLGDPRVVWEINRHHHLVTLARAYALTGEPRFARGVWETMSSWIDGNPPLFGINWASPLEIAIRLVSWALAVDLVGSAEAEPEVVGKVGTSVLLQARQVYDNLSSYASSRNNHLIGEAAGLLVAGTKFPFLKSAHRWAERGRSLLEREVAAQVTEDGVSREQAFHYQAFVIEFLVVGLVAAERAGRPLSAQFRERLWRMARFIAAVAAPDGTIPAIGDADGGRVLELSEGPCERQAIRAAVTAATALGRRLDVAVVPSDLEPAAWLLGADRAAAVAGSHAAEDERDVLERAFPDGGYFVAGGRGHHGVIDCGPLGYLAIAAHGHADCLAVTFWYRGRWVAVDPGTYCYHRERAWRDHFRHTACHNTVVVDGAPQSEMLGPFMWGRRARPHEVAWARGPTFDFFEGWHDGYVSKFGVVHRRAVVFGRAGYWVVVDRIEGHGTHSVRGTVQLADGFDVCGEDESILTDGERGLAYRWWAPGGAAVRVIEGQREPPAGWISPAFGLKKPAPAIVVEGRVRLPALLVFFAAPFGDEPRVAAESCVVGASGAEVVVATPDGQDRLLFGPRYGREGLSFVGRFGVVAERGSSTVTYGVDVDSWSEEGLAVRFTQVSNVLEQRH